MAGAAGGLAVGAVGGALVSNAMGTYYYVHFVESPFPLSNQHYHTVFINAKLKNHGADANPNPL